MFVCRVWRSDADKLTAANWAASASLKERSKQVFRGIQIQLSGTHSLTHTHTHTPTHWGQWVYTVSLPVLSDCRLAVKRELWFRSGSWQQLGSNKSNAHFTLFLSRFKLCVCVCVWEGDTDRAVCERPDAWRSVCLCVLWAVQSLLVFLSCEKREITEVFFSGQRDLHWFSSWAPQRRRNLPPCV